MDPADKSGEFKRQVSSFRDWISNEPGSKFPAEKSRYHLYISYACPWVSIYLPGPEARRRIVSHLTDISNAPQATRAIIARKLKGLEDFISVSSVHWHLGEKGRPPPQSEPREIHGKPADAVRQDGVSRLQMIRTPRART